MPLTEIQVRSAERIFNFALKHKPDAIQAYNPAEEFRTNTTIAKHNRLSMPIICSEIYINVLELTAWQIKAFKERANKLLPDNWFIEEHPKEKIIRFGFR
jgi:hypothetical protein